MKMNLDNFAVSSEKTAWDKAVWRKIGHLINPSTSKDFGLAQSEYTVEKQEHAN